MNTMDLKNIGKLAGIAAWALATFGGCGYACAGGHYLIGTACIALGVITLPTIVKWVKKSEIQ